MTLERREHERGLVGYRAGGGFDGHRIRSWVVCIVAALASLGCQRGTIVVPVTHPAMMPVRVYPNVIIGHGPDPGSAHFADLLARHLMSPPPTSPAVSAIVRVRPEVDAMIAAQSVSPGTAIMDIQAYTSTRVVRESRPVSYQNCSWGRCGLISDTQFYDQPYTTMTLVMAVRDIRTGAIIHALRHSEEFASAGARTTARLAERIADRLLPAVDMRLQRVRVRLLPVEDARVEEAITQMKDGAFRDARVLLEEAVRSEEVHSLGPEQVARALYNLSVARRYDPTTQDNLDRHFEAARAPLRAALSRDPSNTLYQEMLRQLEEDEARARLLAEQHSVAEEYAADSTPAAAIPDGYR